MAIWASDFIYQQRMQICNSCEEFVKTLKVCKSCGCFMPAKAKIANLRCPKDKWTEVYGTEDQEPKTLSLHKGSDDIEKKKESLLRQAQHLKDESDRLFREVKKLDGTN